MGEGLGELWYEKEPYYDKRDAELRVSALNALAIGAALKEEREERRES